MRDSIVELNTFCLEFGSVFDGWNGALVGHFAVLAINVLSGNNKPPIGGWHFPGFAQGFYRQKVFLKKYFPRERKTLVE